MKAGEIPLDTFVDLEGDPYADPYCSGVGCVWRTHVAQVVDRDPSMVEDRVAVKFLTAGANEEETQTLVLDIPAWHEMTIIEG